MYVGAETGDAQSSNIYAMNALSENTYRRGYLPSQTYKIGGQKIEYFNRTVGNKHYELKDHLGNVHAVVTDKRIWSNWENTPEIITLSDYYPFGWLSNNVRSSDYRYNFQNQEFDQETGWVNYKYRMHDPRTGRFFAVDPLTGKYPYYSPYQFSGNRVIDAIELEGLEPAEIIVYNNPFNSTPVFALKLKPGDLHYDQVYKSVMSMKWNKDVSHAIGGTLEVSYSDYNNKNSMKKANWKDYTISNNSKKSWEEMSTYEKWFETTPTQRSMHGWGNEYEGNFDQANIAGLELLSNPEEIKGGITGIVGILAVGTGGYGVVVALEGGLWVLAVFEGANTLSAIDDLTAVNDGKSVLDDFIGSDETFVIKSVLGVTGAGRGFKELLDVQSIENVIGSSATVISTSKTLYDKANSEEEGEGYDLSVEEEGEGG